MQKGSTPAGMHRSICADEILEFLQIQPGQVGLDATLGYGGHTLEMLKLFGFKGISMRSMWIPLEWSHQARLETWATVPKF